MVSVSTAAGDLGVVDILRVAGAKDLFLRASRENGCEEEALFLSAMMAIRTEPSFDDPLLVSLGKTTLEDQIKGIYRDFLEPGALYEIAIPRSLRRELMGDFEPLTRRKKKERTWWLRGKHKNCKGSSKSCKVFVSGLTAVPEHSEVGTHTSSTASTPPPPLIARMMQPPKTADAMMIDYMSALTNIGHAANIAEQLLTIKVSEERYRYLGVEMNEQQLSQATHPHGYKHQWCNHSL